jgi:hypothetical protein
MPFPTLIDSWPTRHDAWVTGYEGFRHFVPAGGGVVGACGALLPRPPMLSFPDLDGDCCDACLRLAFAPAVVHHAGGAW